MAKLTGNTVVTYVQLVVSCGVLGLGVALLLEAALGSDGYSTLVNGLTLTTGWPFWLLNGLVGGALLAAAWARGARPGPGTVVQWLLVGFVVSGALAVIPPVGSTPGRVLVLTGALLLLTLGIAGYLATHTGAGPVEAVALAWDPPMPFRWTYVAVQGGGSLVGWLLGASIGLGTVAVVVLLGPAVDLVLRRAPQLQRR